MRFPDLVVNVGKDEKTGKYHAFYLEPDGSRMQGPPRDTSSEAAKDGEEIIQLARRKFEEAGFTVSATQRVN